MRPLLRPGLQILRRDLRTLQLGLDWPGVCTLLDTPALQAVLGSIDGFRDLSGVIMAAASRGVEVHEARSALEVLIDCGAVVDQASCWRGERSESSWAALWLLAGPGRAAEDLVADRALRRVGIVGDGQVADQVHTLLSVAQLTIVESAATADVVVLASDSEPLRDSGDEALRDNVAHLWVHTRDVVGVVGPFVLPGITGCLRCADRTRAETDPAWLTLVESAAVRRLAAPACDPLLAALVGAWAAQEVAVWASGLRPQTLDSLIEVPQGFGDIDKQSFGLHPHCGCGWPAWRDTMGA